MDICGSLQEDHIDATLTPVDAQPESNRSSTDYGNLGLQLTSASGCQLALLQLPP